MSRRLILVRHGVASFQAASDFDRPLVDQQPALQQTASWLQMMNIQPTCWLVSPATRCQQTAQLLTDMFAKAGSDLAKVDKQTEDDFYLASHSKLLSRIEWHEQGDLLLIGHQPGLNYLASGLSASPLNEFLDPGQAFIVELPDSWFGLAEASASRIDYSAA